MRTWSVRGTALALCTRSSSLSIRTRTSMGVSVVARSAKSLLERVGEPNNAALVGIHGPDRLDVRPVRERPHQTLRADVPGAGRAAQERDHLAVARPRGRVGVGDQPMGVLAAGVDDPERV